MIVMSALFSRDRCTYVCDRCVVYVQSVCVLTGPLQESNLDDMHTMQKGVVDELGIYTYRNIVGTIYI